MAKAHIQFCARRYVGPWLAAAILIFAAVMKFVSPSSMAEVWRTFGIPGTGMTTATRALASVEILQGLALLIRPASVVVRACGIVVFLVFCVSLLYLMSMTDPPNCGCLGKIKIFESERAELLFGLGRNLCLTAGLVSGFMESPQRTNGSHRPDDR